MWRKAAVDVTPLAGTGPVLLQMFTSDTGDSIFDTAVLLDAIRLL